MRERGRKREEKRERGRKGEGENEGKKEREKYVDSVTVTSPRVCSGSVQWSDGLVPVLGALWEQGFMSPTQGLTEIYNEIRSVVREKSLSIPELPLLGSLCFSFSLSRINYSNTGI